MFITRPAPQKPRGLSTHLLRRRIQFFPLLLASLLALGDAPLLSQQAAQQGPPITSEVNMVNMLASVRDKKGHLVNNLTKDDFAVDQDGHAQTITYFAQESNLPLTLGLLVDTSMSQRRVLDQERSASHTFIEKLLRIADDPSTDKTTANDKD